MKKPGKPKPKRRAQSRAAPAHAPARSAAGKAKAARSPAAVVPSPKPAVRAKSATKGLHPARGRAAGGGGVRSAEYRFIWPLQVTTTAGASRTFANVSRARAAVATALEAYPSEDRTAVALLLLPLLIMTVSLGVGQSWRHAVGALPEIALTAPMAHPASTAPLSVKPAPGTPPVDVAGLDPRSSNPAPPTSIPVAPVAPANPGHGVDITTWVPPQAGWHDAFATPPKIDPAPAPAAPAAPTPAPASSFDIATWSPPQSGWHDRFAAPPPFDPAPAASLAMRPAVPAPTAPIIAVPAPSGEPASVAPVSVGEMCRPSATQLASFGQSARGPRPRQPLADTSDPVAFGLKLAAAARAQTADLVVYNARYMHMAFPMGDMPSMYGACTDVIIRAYRTVGIDLQELVQRTHSGRGDTNIDHRRTETLRVLFARGGGSLPVTKFPEDYKPGDVVTYHRPFSRVSSSHIAMVSDVLAPSGRPMIVHNRGWGPQLEDALFVDRITGHYRYTARPTEPQQTPALTASAGALTAPNSSSTSETASDLAKRGPVKGVLKASFHGHRPVPSPTATSAAATSLEPSGR